MKDWKKSVVPPSATVAEVMENLNLTGSRIVLGVGADMRLEGIVTDGDLRRGLTGFALFRIRGAPASRRDVRFNRHVNAVPPSRFN